jgi:basic amino acid/polyamine antiporter, APA family
VPHTSPPPLPAHPPLRRELGRWDLTAIGINQVIGGGIFLVPAAVAASVGAWSPWLVAAVGLVSLLIALSFAEVGSRFTGTGGPYLYSRAAFGRFMSFEVGWMQWFTRAASWASVINGLADSLGYYTDAVRMGPPRAALITGVIAVITFVNVRGIRLSSWVINGFTIGKLVPLLTFIVVGLFFVDIARLAPGGAVTPGQVSAGVVMLIFALGGYEVIPITGGETRDPRRAIPFAMVMTVVSVTLVTMLAQVVAVGTLPGLAGSRTPLADAAMIFLGGGGALLLTVGATVSMSGNNFGQSLSGSRGLFALGEHGDIPPAFGWVHPRYRTPAFAIIFTSAVTLALALSGTFATLAAGSAISRLFVYAATCAATLELRRPRHATRVRPALFVVPGGHLIPAAGILISVAIVAFATPRQIVVGLGALVVGAGLYALTRLHYRGGAPPPDDFLGED